MYRNIFCIFMYLISSTTAVAVVVRESFDKDLGLFDSVVGLPGGGNDFGYSDTSNAGGNPGELGGIVARNQSMARYVADGTLGGNLSTREEVTMSGQLMLKDINFQGHFFFGFFNTADFPIEVVEIPNNSLGLVFLEPGERSEGDFRVRVGAGGVFSAMNTLPNAPLNQVVYFSLTFTPSGAGDGSGTLAVDFDSLYMTIPIAPNEDVYNAFGLVSGYSPSSAANRNVEVYFDNLVYTSLAGAGAYGPTPFSGQDFVPRDVVLSWTPGPSATVHDVYFGTRFDDVNEADTLDPRGVLLRQNLDANSYDPGRLEFGQTCYWRVDDVNIPTAEVIKGIVWSFIVESEGYPFVPVAADASSTLNELFSAERTIDRSGLDVNDLHSADGLDMWQSSFLPAPAWLQYRFDQAYYLYNLQIWNANQFTEPFKGIGIKDISIETSLDGDTWTPVGDFVVPQGPGMPGYAANPPIALGGAEAQYVKITIHSNWGGTTPQFSVSEVAFSYLPVWAREPHPDNGATGVAPTVAFSWRSGRGADSHILTVSTDPETVIETTDNSYDTTALDLQLGESYSWTVSEVNEAETPPVKEGDVWTFSTAETLVFDDMESYRNELPFMIWQTWQDGTEFGTNDPGNGSTVGADPMMNDYSPATGLGRGQSLPIWFDNTTVSKSEATRLLAGENWTLHGIQGLSLYIQSGADNTGGGRIYIKINDKQVYYPDADLPLGWGIGHWLLWNLDLSTVDTDLTHVTKFIIGIEGANAKGVLYVDDIEFYKDAPASEQVVSWFEAESGTVTAPMQIYDAIGTTTSGDRYIGTEELGETGDRTSGMATYSFTIAEAGTYKIYGRTITASGANSFWVRIPGAPVSSPPAANNDGFARWNDMPNSETWIWDDMDNDEGPNPGVLIYTLDAGTYTLEIGYREDGALLDAIAIVAVPE